MVTASQIRPGAKVLTVNGRQVGTVKGVAPDAIKVERGLGPNLWLGCEDVSCVFDGIGPVVVMKDRLPGSLADELAAPDLGGSGLRWQPLSRFP